MADNFVKMLIVEIKTIFLFIFITTSWCNVTPKIEQNGVSFNRLGSLPRKNVYQPKQCEKNKKGKEISLSKSM